MKVFALLWREQRSRFVFTTALLATNTLLNIALIGLIGRYTTQMKPPPMPWWQFLLLMSCVVGTQLMSSLLTARTASSTATLLRDRLLQGLSQASLTSLEQIGKSRVMVTLIDDVERVRASLQTIIMVGRDLSLALGILVYLPFVSFKLTGIVLTMLVIGAAIFRPLRKSGLAFATNHRRASDAGAALLSDLLDGAKQLKADHQLRSALLDAITARAFDVEQAGYAMSRAFAFGIQSAMFCYFAAFLILTYVPIDSGLGPEAMAVFVVGLMIALTPLVNAAFAIQQLDVANLSLSRTHQLLQEIALDPRDDKHDIVERPTAVRSLELRDLFHRCRTAEREDFALGPINFTVRAGECLFIVGGNGSGKTTLLKLIAGLYEPAGGDIRINGELIDSRRRHWLRQQVSAVFADSCLFESLQGSHFDYELTKRGTSMLTELSLEQAISRDRTLLSQAPSCSSGERKRLSLVLARLADKPIYMFDEFAADQDPRNKRLFYEHIVPRLKVAKKIVIVISHDDKYFEHADYLLILDRGSLPTLRRNAAPVSAPIAAE